jgi:hypothetical protein
MRYKLLIVVGVALAVVVALALFRLGGAGNKTGVTEPTHSQQTGGLVLRCPFNLTNVTRPPLRSNCTSKGLFPPTQSRPQNGTRFHWTAASS